MLYKLSDSNCTAIDGGQIWKFFWYSTYTVYNAVRNCQNGCQTSMFLRPWMTANLNCISLQCCTKWTAASIFGFTNVAAAGRCRSVSITPSPSVPSVAGKTSLPVVWQVRRLLPSEPSAVSNEVRCFRLIPYAPRLSPSWRLGCSADVNYLSRGCTKSIISYRWKNLHRLRIIFAL